MMMSLSEWKLKRKYRFKQKKRKRKRLLFQITISSLIFVPATYDLLDGARLISL